MTELDQLWSSMISQAAVKAAGSGRDDIAEYLRLRAANDAIRSEGVRWLLDAAVALAADANRQNAGISIEAVEPHRFVRGNSTMVGQALELRRGVRCLTFEAGWTRTPTDGIMRGGILAAAKISHFGMRRSDVELSLAYDGELPLWHFEIDDQPRRPVRIVDIHKHFLVFLAE